MNHFQHTVGAPLYGTEAFPTQQSQIQRFMKEVCVCVGRQEVKRASPHYNPNQTKAGVIRKDEGLGIYQKDWVAVLIHT